MPTGGPTTSTPRTGLAEAFTQRGAGSDYTIETGQDDKFRAFKRGDAFPRMVFDFLNGDILVGNGTVPPVSIIGNVGPGGNGLPVYNVVTAYHADNTGVTDAASPINQAISDAHAAGGGIVFVPIGLYSVASADIVMLSGVILLGESRHGAILVDNRSSGSTIRLRGTDQNTLLERCHVEQIQVSGNNPGTNGRKGVEVQFATRCVVTECEILNSAHGAWVYGSSAITISTNRFKACSTTDGSNKAAIQVLADASGNTADVHVTGNQFDGCFERLVYVAGSGSHRPDSVEVAANQANDSNVRGTRILAVTTAGLRVHDNTLSLSAFDSGFSTPVNVIQVADQQGASIRSNRFVLTGAGMVNVCVDVDATSASNRRVAVVDNDLAANASCAPATSMTRWRFAAPTYNLAGTDWGNGVSFDGSGTTVLCVGMPNTVTPTHQWGPINVREYAVGDGVAFDGPALQAWLTALLNQGREGRWAAGTYLCQSDASTPTLLVIDKATGIPGQTVITGEGEDTTMCVWNVDLGFDTFGMPNYPWNPLHCGTQNSIDLSKMSFQGHGDHSNATYNANATPVPMSRGYGPRIPNRCHYNWLSVKGFHTGFVIDGSNGGGEYVVVGKVDGSPNVVVDTSISPVPPSSIIGLAAAGGGVPAGTTVTAVSGNTITLSHNINNGSGQQTTDLTVGAPVTTNTDHFTCTDLYVQECHDGYLVRRNSGNVGGGSTGTKDQRFVRCNAGRCQRAGFVASEDGYYAAITFDTCHIANLPHFALKEGTPGIVPSQQNFLSDIVWVRTKSEGSGTIVMRCISGRSLCQDWQGIFKIEDGLEINNRATHKFVNATGSDHTIKPITGTATRVGSLMTVTVGSLIDSTRKCVVSGGAGTNVTSWAGAGTLTVDNPTIIPVCGVAFITISGSPVLFSYTGQSVTQLTGLTLLAGTGIIANGQVVNPSVLVPGDMLGCEGLNTGGNPDKLYTDCAAVTTVVSSTQFTALLGSQTKSMTAAYGSGVSTISISGNPNVKNQDEGTRITADNATIPAGTYLVNANFFGQTADLNTAPDGTGSPVLTTGASSGATGNVTTFLPDNATPANVRVGKVGAFYLGDVQGWNITMEVKSNFTSENVGAEMWWDLNTGKQSRITLNNDTDFPSVNLRAGGTERSINFRVDRADCEAVLSSCFAPIVVGNALEINNNGARQPTALFTTAPFGGIARQGANPGFTTVAVSPFAGTGLPPLLLAARPFLFCQEKGPNYLAATVEGGGLVCENPTLGKKELVVSNTNTGRVEAWDGSTTNRLCVGYSYSPNVGNRVDAKVHAAYRT